jgi:DNA-binding NarL/FixJ family response regulator
MRAAEGSATARARHARVLSVDDQPAFLAVLRDLVSATRELEAVAEAQSGEMAIQVARELAPDIVLIDASMPGMGGLAAAKEIKANRPSTVVVLISVDAPR